MPGQGQFRDAEIRRDAINVPISSAIADSTTLAAAAVGKTPICIALFVTFQGTDQVSLESPSGTGLTGAMQFKVDGILDLPECWIPGAKGQALLFKKAQAVAARGFATIIYR